MAEPDVTEEVIEEEPEAPVEEEVQEDEAEEEEAEEEEDDEDTEPEPPVSRRKALRIQSLIEKLQGGEDRVSAPPTRRGLDYKTALETDEATAKALEDDRSAFGAGEYSRGLQQANNIQFHTRLEIDSPRIEAKFPQFDKNSPKFNPVATDAINKMYLSTVGYNEKTGDVRTANVRYYDYVESLMELADEMAGQKVAVAKKNITRQAAKTGLRPGGKSPKRLNLNQAPQDMTNEELLAAIAASSR